jgi:hypothetical protein
VHAHDERAPPIRTQPVRSSYGFARTVQTPAYGRPASNFASSNTGKATRSTAMERQQTMAALDGMRAADFGWFRHFEGPGLSSCPVWRPGLSSAPHAQERNQRRQSATTRTIFGAIENDAKNQETDLTLSEKVSEARI